MIIFRAAWLIRKRMRVVHYERSMSINFGGDEVVENSGAYAYTRQDDHPIDGEADEED